MAAAGGRLTNANYDQKPTGGCESPERSQPATPLLDRHLKNENISRKTRGQGQENPQGLGDGSPGPAQAVASRNRAGFPSPLGSRTPRSGLGTGNYFSSPGMQGEFRAGLSRHSQAPDFGYPASFRLPNCSSGGGSDAGNTGCPQLRPAGADTACGTTRCPPSSSAEPLQTAEPSLGLGSRLDRGKAAGRELPPLRARLRVLSARHSGF